MKRLILFVAVVGLAGAATLWVVRRNSTSAISTQPAADSAPAPEAEIVVPENPAPPAAKPPRRNSATVQERPAIPESAPSVASANAAAPDETTVLRQTVEMLISPQTSFEKKQAAWIKLRTEGKLNQVIAELEQRAASNPNVAEYPAALGQAYLHKIASSQDVREHGILGLKADLSFDAALELDPANWEAGFSKAMAMSYWPAEMNKRTEVIERFNQLIRQQEEATPQPHFAQTYVWLGDQYQKAGRADYAGEVWRRGTVLFPSDQALQKKLTP